MSYLMLMSTTACGVDLVYWVLWLSLYHQHLLTSTLLVLLLLVVVWSHAINKQEDDDGCGAST